MKRILITRPSSQADAFATALSQAGFDPILLPVIEIRPMDDHSGIDRALLKLACYDWVIFTSANAVEVFWRRLAALGIDRLPAETRLAAIGPRTAAALHARGSDPTFVPEEYVAEAILPGLGDVQDRWVLLPRAEIARKALPEALLKAGGIVHEIAIYQTLPAEPDATGLQALRDGVDVITFTSPSTVYHFLGIAQRAGLDPLHLPHNPQVACIGPITAAAASQEGLRVDMVARNYTSAGLVELLQNQEKQ